MKKVRLHERGAAHVLAIAVFVLILGAVGFVGYNAWQNRETSAGNATTVASSSSYSATDPTTYRYGTKGLCRMYSSLHAKINVYKSIVKIKSGSSTILSVDTQLPASSTRFLTTKPYKGKLATAKVKYIVNTPTTKTVKKTTKKGKTKFVSKTTWKKKTTTIKVADLPRCVPTDDPAEFNFKKGLSKPQACIINGEIVVAYSISSKYRASDKPKLTVSLDGKVAKSVALASKDIGTNYYMRVPAKGKKVKVSFTAGKYKYPSLMNKKISKINSCL